ncbi:MAG: hypothetical protein ABI855_02645 [Bacteroidota bacterium]
MRTKNIFHQFLFFSVSFYILNIEALDDDLKIHVSNEKAVVSKMTMKAVLEKLPLKEFYSCTLLLYNSIK